MGKNAGHKAMQAAKHSSRGAGEAGGTEPSSRYGDVDASFHTSEWHAARLAALQMERPSWDDWKKQQDDAAAREAAMEAAVAEADLEYKAGLVADRARRLGYAPKDAGVKKEKKSKKRKHKSKDSKSKKSKKKSKREKKSKKKKRRHSSSSSSGSDSDSSSSSSGSDSDMGGVGEPVKLSKYLNS